MIKEKLMRIGNPFRVTELLDIREANIHDPLRNVFCLALTLYVASAATTLLCIK